MSVTECTLLDRYGLEVSIGTILVASDSGHTRVLVRDLGSGRTRVILRLSPVQAAELQASLSEGKEQ